MKKKNAPNVFLNELNKKNETKYNHFAITYIKNWTNWIAETGAVLGEGEKKKDGLGWDSGR